MMRHTTVRTLLASRPDLSPREQQRLEHHLSDCSECRMIGQEYRRQQALLRQYRLRPAPVSARSMAPVQPAWHIWDALDQIDRSMRIDPARARRWRMHTKLYAALAVAVAAVIVAATSVTMAGSRQGSITNLGPPTNARPQFPPTGGFHRVKTTLTSHGLPELLFIGTLIEPKSAGERWAVVKALNQFGTLSNVSAVVTRSCSYPNEQPATQAQCDPAVMRGFVTGVATYDWSHAVYHSRYLVFVHKDLIDQNLQMRQTLTPLERSLFTRTVAFTGYSNWHDTVWHTAIDEQSGGNQSGRQRFPLVAISRYLQSDAEVAIYGDLSDVAGRLNLPFATIQQSLQKGRAQGTASPSLITDYNAEANLLTAFICHADGLKPAKVCHRSVIRSILKHIR